MSQDSKSKEREFPFTQKRLDALPPPKSGRIEYRDEKPLGF